MRNISKFGRQAKIMALLGLFMVTGSALAECKQANMTGTWFISGTFDDSTEQKWAPETSYCKVKVGSSGNVIASASSCVSRNYEGKDSLNITGGRLRVNSSCLVTGQINYRGNIGSTSFVIDSGRLDRQKTVFNMIGYATFDRDFIAMMVGVKK